MWTKFVEFGSSSGKVSNRSTLPSIKGPNICAPDKSKQAVQLPNLWEVTPVLINWHIFRFRFKHSIDPSANIVMQTLILYRERVQELALQSVKGPKAGVSD